MPAEACVRRFCEPAVTPNKQMQRARTVHKCVLGYVHQRVADLRR
jgi:hypothetical protein